MGINHIAVDANITYQNGARVRTGFVTNLGSGGVILQTAPELCRAIDAAQRLTAAERAAERAAEQVLLLPLSDRETEIVKKLNEKER